MPGVPDPLYVAARAALLDALEALGPHRRSIILVGAQAVYVRTGEGGLAVAPFTTDADLALDPRSLGESPLLEGAMENAGFTRGSTEVGMWTKTVSDTSAATVVDLLVPDSLGGGGRRAARLPPHGKGTARKVVGLEGALIDNDPLPIPSLDPADHRAYDLPVAGPAALIVAKSFKISDRASDVDRLSDKDALDVLRLLQACPTQDVAERMTRLLADEASAEVTARALDLFEEHFATPRSAGARMAARALTPLEEEATVRSSIATLAQRLLEALGHGRSD